VSPNGLGFAKKVGVVAGAALAVIALGNTLGGCVMKTMFMPEFQRIISEERMAREKADRLLANSIVEMNVDRTRLLTVMEERNSIERIRLLRQLRAETEKRISEQQPQIYGR